MIFQQLINGLMLGATYSLVAIGYTLIFGVLGLLHFAHGEVLMVGAFMGLYIINWSNLPFYITLPLAMVATGVLGIIIDLLAIRPIRKDFHLAPLLSTIGVTIILQNLAIKLFGGYGTRFPDAIETVHYNVGPLLISSINVLILGISLFLMVVLYLFIAKTKVGKAMRAVSESHLTAELLGVNVDRIVLFTFGVASALAGAAGVMIGLAFHAISPFIGLTFGLKGLVVMLLGGLGNVVGAMIGGLILGIAEVIAIVVLPTEINLQDIFSFGIMILILIFRPTGLFGTRVTQA
ncbi:MAG: branched-chain amino acid ABC transporter permease [Deltaproteobacteria bacterium]|nr:branched-chain amino acid ABC transporter permease [Deltaproteobacteria bacterium]MCZ6907282.1 branched-chain amino acid ABC transporter permease [Deltaproteobacteria bacterium]